MTSVEVCAGAGGQALGLEMAGFDHVALVEIDHHCCKTLKLNRPLWSVLEEDLNNFDPSPYVGVDLFAGGLPCPPFSVAGKQLGEKDERNLFPAALRVIGQIKPKAVMIENVRGFLSPTFTEYRDFLKEEFRKLGFIMEARLYNSSDFGVPQLRPRVAIVAIRSDLADRFTWPELDNLPPPLTVGAAIGHLMGARGWVGAKRWAAQANAIAPTLVGGSKKHGGPDLGPTRAKKAWAAMGVNGNSLAEEAPDREFIGMPRLTVEMAAALQGFPSDWKFYGKKTAAYRQVGNAFPPPFAKAIASEIANAISTQRIIYKASAINA